MERLFEVFKQIMPDFKGNKITLGGLFMLFGVTLIASYFFLKYVMNCTFQNPALVIVWIIIAFSLSMAVSCFYSAFIDWFEKQAVINADKKYFFSVLDKSGETIRDFFKACIDNNTDIFEIREDERNILKVLDDREIYIARTFSQDNFKYGIINPRYFEWLKEYFKDIR